MQDIGVKELKAELSSVLRRVESGEGVRVTSRGRPVAEILPVGAPRPRAALRRLAAEGRVTLASKERSKRPPRPVESDRSATAIVLEDRAAER